MSKEPFMHANLQQSFDGPDAAASAIAQAAPFRDLPEPVVSSLAEASSVRTYSAGETVFAMGQFDGSEFMIVRSGKLQIAHADPNSGSMLIEHVGGGGGFCVRPGGAAGGGGGPPAPPPPPTKMGGWCEKTGGGGGFFRGRGGGGGGGGPPPGRKKKPPRAPTC